jgi:hypothetical protein
VVVQNNSKKDLKYIFSVVNSATGDVLTGYYDAYLYQHHNATARFPVFMLQDFEHRYDAKNMDIYIKGLPGEKKGQSILCATKDFNISNVIENLSNKNSSYIGVIFTITTIPLTKNKLFACKITYSTSS